MKRLLLALAIPAALILAGCSSSPAETDIRPSATATFNALDGLELPTETSAAKVTSAPKVTTTKPASGDIYGVTPNGLTTSVNAPITMSPAELKQGCIDIKSWADSLGITDAETILGFTQMTEADSNEFMTVTDGDGRNWANSSPSDRAAVIATVTAAMSGEC